MPSLVLNKSPQHFNTINHFYHIARRSPYEAKRNTGLNRVKKKHNQGSTTEEAISKEVNIIFTVTLRDRHSSLLIDEIKLLRESMRVVQMADKYTIDAIVVLPEHLHTIWQLPKNDMDYSKRWRKIKSCFTRSLLKLGYPIKKNNRGEYPIWQKRFWEHTIRDEKDLEAHVNYIHYNPVKHGLTEQVSDWPYSSFHRYIRQGLLLKNWGENALNEKGINFGE